MRFENKVVIVTGASSGIGRSTARLFAKEGAKVIAAARRMKRLEALRQEGIDKGWAGEIYPLKIDVRDPAQIEMMFEKTMEVYGRLDVLVNNAGVLDGMLPVHETSDDVYNMVYETNQRAVFLCCKHALKIFLAQGGNANIVNVASAASLRGLKGGAMYVMTKHAVLGLTRNIAASFFDRGIRCNCIEPGNIKTDVNKAYRDLGIGIPEWEKRVWDAAPLHTITPVGEKRPNLGTPLDCANAIAFLADDKAARYISGAELRVDAGFLDL